MSDLRLGDDGDLPQQLSLIDGEALARQRIARRCATHEGEVLTDRRAGLPFAAWIASRAAPAVIADRVRLELGTAPGVATVLRCSAAFDRGARRTTIEAEAQLQSGAVVAIRLGDAGGNSAAGWRPLMRGAGGLWPS